MVTRYYLSTAVLYFSITKKVLLDFIGMPMKLVQCIRDSANGSKSHRLVTYPFLGCYITRGATRNRLMHGFDHPHAGLLADVA